MRCHNSQASALPCFKWSNLILGVGTTLHDSLLIDCPLAVCLRTVWSELWAACRRGAGLSSQSGSHHAVQGVGDPRLAAREAVKPTKRT